MTNPGGQQSPYQPAPSPYRQPQAGAGQPYQAPMPGQGPYAPYGGQPPASPQPSPYGPAYGQGGYVMQHPTAAPDPMQQPGYYSSDGRLVIPAAAPIGGAQTMNLSPQTGVPAPAANPGSPYAGQPQYPYPYGRPPRRNRTGVIIACVAGAVVLVLAIIIGLLAIAGTAAEGGTSDSGTTSASGPQPVPANDPARMRSAITRITGAQCTWRDDSAKLNASMVGTEGAYTCGNDMTLVMFSNAADTDTTMQYVGKVLDSGNDLFGLSEGAPRGGEEYAVLHSGTWMVIGGDAEMSALHNAWGGSLQQFGSGSATDSHGSTSL